MFIAADRSTADDKIWWQGPLLTYVSLLQNPSANASLLDIYQPIETWLDVSLIISLLRNVSVRFLLILFLQSIIVTYSRQLFIFIECIIIPSVKVWGKYIFFTKQKFYTKNSQKTLIFLLLLRSTAVAVKSGCFSNLQIFIMVRYKIYIFYLYVVNIFYILFYFVLWTLQMD